MAEKMMLNMPPTFVRSKIAVDCMIECRTQSATTKKQSAGLSFVWKTEKCGIRKKSVFFNFQNLKNKSLKFNLMFLKHWKMNLEKYIFQYKWS